MEFNKLNIIEPILRAVKEQGYTNATPIQEQAIPPAIEGRDILGCAQTGTGKTAAFSIPTIQHLNVHDGTKIRALILTPTRELAAQIQDNITAYAKYTSIRSTVIFGGVSQKPQEQMLRRGMDIIVATPGRLNDLINQRILDISKIEVFILDEADRMLDMGFLNDIKKIIAKVPEKKQTLFFSATMPKEIKALTQKLLNDPVIIEVTPVSSTVDKIDQTLYYVDKANKKHLLLDLLNKDNIQNALIFTRTKSNADRLAKFLLSYNINTGVIHGNKSQGARQHSLSQFKEGKSRILVATDIAARGIDINELSHVFNYDIPNEAESYVHRIGRTGRAGNAGTSISFCDVDEMDQVKSIQKLIDYKIPVNREHEYPMLVTTPSPKKKPGQRKQRSNSPKRATDKRSTSSEAIPSKSATSKRFGKNRDQNKTASPFSKTTNKQTNQRRKTYSSNRGK